MLQVYKMIRQKGVKLVEKEQQRKRSGKSGKAIGG